ncbi:carboxymuconolactone decarboxylase family protein [Streptomyces sp. NPDC102462]|uniref:carboxymuconolactone decarboxylase family protein n=1 Tax=Streptomyces sp. NPDC102462 TaxID=3366178 RepID=UPI00382614E9
MSHPTLYSTVDVPFPNLDELPERVRERFDDVPVKVNLFRMLAHSPGTFVEVMDLTDAVFKRLTLDQYSVQLLVLFVATQENNAYEWDQHVSIAGAAGVKDEQMLAIAEDRWDDPSLFSDGDRVLLRFAAGVLRHGKAPAVLFKNSLKTFGIQELADALIVIGFYRMISGFMLTLDIPIDAQSDGTWITK